MKITSQFQENKKKEAISLSFSGFTGAKKLNTRDVGRAREKLVNQEQLVLNDRFGCHNTESA